MLPPTPERPRPSHPRLALALAGLLSILAGPAQAQERPAASNAPRSSTRAQERPLTSDALRRVDARLAPTRPPTRSLVLEAGDTAFLEARLVLPRSRLRRPAEDYEGVLTKIGTQDGIALHPRVDSLRFVTRGGDIEVIYVYVVSAEAKARRGGRTRATFALREKFGLANTIASEKIEHSISVVPAQATANELAADFHGYRHYMRRARQRLDALAKAGLRTLSIEDRAPIPSTRRLTKQGQEQLREFERERRRAWVARRHISAAAQSKDPALAALGRGFLKNLAKPAAAWSGLPDNTFLAGRAEPGPEPRVSSEKGDGTLAPVAEYRSGTEGTVGSESPSEVRPPVDPEPVLPEPKDTAEPTPGPTAGASETMDDPELLSISEGLERVPTDPTEEARVGRRYYLPTYPRSLLLDDPNIGHSGAVRASFAEVQRPEAASTLAVFYSAQVGLTEDLGLEVTIPTQLVSVDAGPDGRTVYRLGNPLVAAKYRLHMPNVLGRKPTLTLRGRWGIAATQRNQIPATDLFAEDFSASPNLTDTYAFLLERTDIGVGGSLAWRYKWLHVALQLYADYLFPTELATDRTDFVAIGYGASVGALPFGDIVGFYAETRAVSLVGGPRRTELVVYGGARGQLFGFLEPAVWVGAPIGSAADVSGPQIGAELRVTYDLRSIIQVGGRRQATSGVSE